MRFHAVLHFAAPPDSGSVDQYRSVFPVSDDSVDGVPRSAGNFADDRAFVSEQCVEQRRLPYVWPSDYGELGQCRLSVRFFRSWNVCADGIEEIAGAKPV